MNGLQVQFMSDVAPGDCNVIPWQHDDSIWAPQPARIAVLQEALSRVPPFSAY
jgi:hypothetical protein